MLKELVRLARYYAAFSIGVGAPPELQQPLSQLRRLVDVPAILVMRLYDFFESCGTLSVQDFAQAVRLIESYIFRRAIAGEQTRGYWQRFANLTYQLSPDQPLESLKVGLARLPENYAFPSDVQFDEALQGRDIYHKRVCFDLLDRLENHGTKEPVNTSGYSIEHIMPQNEKLSPEWRGMLGQQWKEVHREWLHRLGNLTLTGYNSTYSDRPFDEKKSMPGGFAESAVRLNKFVREQEVWTEREMQNRGQDLAKRALAIWPPLQVEKALIDAARAAEMRERAKRREWTKVPMTASARELLEVLRNRVREIDPHIIEIAEQHSVSYHNPEFFLEILPRKHRLGLLLAVDFNEVDDRSGIAEDTSQWKFFVNAAYEGGVHVRVQTVAEIERALPIIRSAYELVRV